MADIDYGPKIRILVVDDDQSSLQNTALILQKMNHHVVAMKSPIDALNTLRMNNDLFDLVITDVHTSAMSGLEFLKHVGEEFKLPVVLMSADKDKDIMLKAFDGGAAFYLMKPISPNKLSTIWQIVTPPTNDLIPSIESTPLITTSSPNSLTNQGQLMMDVNNNNNININNNNNTYVFGPSNNGGRRIENRQLINKNTQKRPNVNKMRMKAGSVSKKRKLVWTTSLHNLFLDAIKQIGRLDKAVPRKILDLMKVSGLKRENVASHLQKYRIFVKRIQEAASNMQLGFPINWNERPFRSSFVLNEITYLTNNFQQHFHEILAHTQGRMILHGDNIFEQGQNSTQVNNNFFRNTNPIVDTSVIPGDHIQPDNKPVQGALTPNQNALNQPPTFRGNLQGYPAGFSFEQENNFRGEGVFTNHRVGNNVQTTVNNNYVGLRIGANGELVGPSENSTTTVYDKNDGGYNLTNALHGNNYFTGNNCVANAHHQEVNYEMNYANNITSFDQVNATTLVDDFFEIDDAMNMCFNIDVDNNAAQQEISFGMPIELPNLDGTDEELRKLGIEFNGQETYGCEVGFGSYDAHYDDQENLFDGLLNDQAFTGQDDIPFECLFSQEYGQGFYQQDGNIDFTKFN